MLHSGIELANRHEGIRPADDLYRHMNQKWIDANPIPEDRARYGSFLILAEEAEKAVRTIIEECQNAAPGTEARKVGDLYAAGGNSSNTAFSVAGLAPTKDQARFGFDVDHKLSATTLLNFSVHAAGYGQAHDVAGSLSLRRGF